MSTVLPHGKASSGEMMFAFSDCVASICTCRSAYGEQPCKLLGPEASKEVAPRNAWPRSRMATRPLLIGHRWGSCNGACERGNEARFCIVSLIHGVTHNEAATKAESKSLGRTSARAGMIVCAHTQPRWPQTREPAPGQHQHLSRRLGKAVTMNASFLLFVGRDKSDAPTKKVQPGKNGRDLRCRDGRGAVRHTAYALFPNTREFIVSVSREDVRSPVFREQISTRVFRLPLVAGNACRPASPRHLTTSHGGHWTRAAPRSRRKQCRWRC